MKNEKFLLVFVTGLFSLALAYGIFEFGWTIPIMLKYEWFLGLLFLLFTGAHIVMWAYMLKNFDDPDKDWSRKACLGFGIAAALIILAYGAQMKSDRENNIAPSVKIESKKCNIS